MVISNHKSLFILLLSYVIIALKRGYLYMSQCSDKKSVVLLSGGLDSTVALKKSVDISNVVLALTFDYGQRAASKEAAAAAKMSARYNVEHRLIELPWLKEITKTALVCTDEKIPELSKNELDGAGGKTTESAKNVWVPNRNGAFINIAASFAEALGAELIIAGFNMEEAATFPDNSPEFIEAINSSLGYSTLSKVKLVSPTSSLNKKEIVRLGMEIDAPLELIWSCYEGGDKMCGYCESCMRLKRALEDAGSDLLDRLF